MEGFLCSYFIQTRQEIDTEKRERDNLLNFAIAVIGAIAFGILQSPDPWKIFDHHLSGWFGVSLLLMVTSLFWIRRKKLQQVADRWYVLGHLAKTYPSDFPKYSLESMVCPRLESKYYTFKDFFLAFAFSTPVYILLIYKNSLVGCLFAGFHLGALLLLITPGLKNDTNEKVVFEANPMPKRKRSIIRLMLRFMKHTCRKKSQPVSASDKA